MIQKVKWGTLSMVLMMMSCQSNKKSDTAQEVRTNFFDVSGMDTTVNQEIISSNMRMEAG